MPSKILFITHLPPPVHGASMVGTYIKDSQLINQTFDIDYINLSTSEKLEDVGGMNTKKILSLIRIQKKVISALMANHYDLCYMTLTSRGAGFYKDLIVLVILKLFGKKIIYHFHNKGEATVKKSWLNKTLYQFTFRKTFSVLLSPQLYQDIADYVPKNNVFFCPNGIPENGITNISPKLTQGDSALCKLVFLGNMLTSKGVFVLLEACKILNEKSIPFECQFVGGWAEISSSELNTKILEYGLKSKVIAAGPKYGAEKEEILKNCDVFVFPTHYHFEAFPLVILEAMQNQLPVISCPEGGIADMIIDGETGFLVPRQNPEALAEKIEALIQNPELRRAMGLAGKNRFQEFYTLERFEKNMTTILSTAVSKKPV